MPRKLRLEYGGACYHVINRGNYRHAVFAGEGAAESFEKCLGEACERHGWRVHAYVIMRNHFHLALETPEPNLSLGMKFLQGTWANRFNRFRGKTGRPFQGRFKAQHVEPGHALAQVAHYIHLNPVRAKACAPEALAQFRWSSLWRFHQRPRPAWLVADTALAQAGGLKDTAAGWRSYGEYLALLAEESPAQRDQRFKALLRGWAIGSAEFRESLAVKLQQQAEGPMQGKTLRGAEPGDWQGLREDIWESRLRQAARTARIDLARLAPKKSAPEKVLLAAALKATTEVSNGWLAQRLQMGTPASASQFARRFHLDGQAKEDPRYELILSRLAT